jgi:hypothetical protein
MVCQINWHDLQTLECSVQMANNWIRKNFGAINNWYITQQFGMKYVYYVIFFFQTFTKKKHTINHRACARRNTKMRCGNGQITLKMYIEFVMVQKCSDKHNYRTVTNCNIMRSSTAITRLG